MLTIRRPRVYNSPYPSDCPYCGEHLLPAESKVGYCAWHAPQGDLEKCEVCHCAMDRKPIGGSCRKCSDNLSILDDTGKAKFRKMILECAKTRSEIMQELYTHRTDLADEPVPDVVPLPYKKMAAMACKALGAPMNDAFGARRTSQGVQVRAVIAMALLAKGYGTTVIGEAIGRHRVSVLNLRNRFPAFCEEDPRLVPLLEKLKEI